MKAQSIISIMLILTFFDRSTVQTTSLVAQKTGPVSRRACLTVTSEDGRMSSKDALPPQYHKDVEVLRIRDYDFQKLREWPLNRKHYGKLTARLANTNTILFFDLSFYHRYEKQGDKIFSNALAKNKKTILATTTFKDKKLASVIHDYKKRNNKLRKFFLREGPKEKVEHGLQWDNYLFPPLDMFIKRNTYVGSVSSMLSQDEIFKYYNVVFPVKNKSTGNVTRYYPSAILLAAALYFGVNPMNNIIVQPGKFVKITNIPKNSKYVYDFTILQKVKRDIMARPNKSRSLIIPIDQMGRIPLKVYGGKHCVNEGPLLEVNRRSLEDIRRNHKGKILIVGVGYDLGDEHYTQFVDGSHGKLSGPEINAWALSQILNQDFSSPGK